MIDLAKDEKLLLVIHRHWFILVFHISIVFLIYLLPLVVYVLFAGKPLPLGAQTITISPNGTVLFFFAVVWTLFVWMRVFTDWTDHYLDGWIITDKRIIDVEQRGFFSRKFSSFRMERIQDVTVDVRGIIATLLDFGDVHVQTASEDHDFIIKDAPHPKQLKQRVLAESDRVTDTKGGGN